MVRYGSVWYGMIVYGMVWYGMVWYDMVSYGMVWYGIVWYGTTAPGPPVLLLREHLHLARPLTCRAIAAVQYSAHSMQ